MGRIGLEEIIIFASIFLLNLLMDWSILGRAGVLICVFNDDGTVRGLKIRAWNIYLEAVMETFVISMIVLIILRYNNGQN